MSKQWKGRSDRYLEMNQLSSRAGLDYCQTSRGEAFGPMKMQEYPNFRREAEVFFSWKYSKYDRRLPLDYLNIYFLAQRLLLST